MLTHARLKSMLQYDPEDGSWTIIGYIDGHPAGRRMGTVLQKSGYIHIGLDGKKYLSHRLAWFYMTEKWPEKQIDHINGIKADNRWVNLRMADSFQNGYNRPNRRLNNNTGIRGVSQINKRFVARIKIRGKYKHIGTFATAEAAHCAYQETAKSLHGEYYCE